MSIIKSLFSPSKFLSKFVASRSNSEPHTPQRSILPNAAYIHFLIPLYVFLAFIYEDSSDLKCPYMTLRHHSIHSGIRDTQGHFQTKFLSQELIHRDFKMWTLTMEVMGLKFGLSSLDLISLREHSKIISYDCCIFFKTIRPSLN